MKYIDHFIAHLNENHYSMKSILFYRETILTKARKYFDQIKIFDEREVTEQHIPGYINFLKQDKKVSDLHRAKLLNCLKLYFKFLEEKNLIFLNPFSRIDNFKEERIPAKVLTHEEIQFIFSQIKTDNDSGIRARMILELGYSSALRPGEIARLAITDIDFNKGLIHIVKSKYKKDRIVPVGHEAIKWIKKYMEEVRPKYITNVNNDHLIISFLMTGKEMKVKSVNSYIAHILKRNNLKHFKLSKLRTTGATHLLLNGMGLLHIKALLGHDYVTTTKSYLRLTTLELKKELSLKHPRCKLTINN
jgi:integrase/recombinase XerD